MSKRNFLQTMCNKYGDFKISTAFPNGSWTKHRSVLECWHDESMFKFLDTATDRTIFKSEIVLDFDKREDETQEELNQRFKKALDTLKEEGFMFRAYSSGNIGFHVHLIFPDILFYSQTVRTKIRHFFIKKFNCDTMKASENMMITLEYSRHRKSGRPKTLIETYGCNGWEMK